MPYPSTISAFTNPSPTDRLSTTPHSTIETAQNTALTEVENFLGVAGSASVAGTLVYDIRSADSNGGGHVQTANKGGTGQTTFTKGDILVAQSSSVITKLSVGTDGFVPTANSGAATGISWQGVANATNIQNQAYTYARASVMSGSVYGINLSQAVSVLTDGMGFVVKWPAANATSLIALSVNASGPSSVSALIKAPDLTNLPTGYLQASMISILEFDSVSSVFQHVSSPTKTPYSQTYRATATFSGGGNNTITPGFLPKSINIFAVAAASGTTDPGAVSTGGWDPVNGNMCAGRDTTSGAVVSAIQCYRVGTANNSNVLSGSISSVIGGSFVLTNVLAGTQTAQLYIECQG